MDTILLKYHHLGKDYLVYDVCKNSRKLNERAVRTICTRNFGLGTRGILAGPVIEGEKVGMKIYQPDGKESRIDQCAAETFCQYLKDAGYDRTRTFVLHTEAGDLSSDQIQEDAAEAVGKMYLSEQFAFGRFHSVQSGSNQV